MDCGKKFTLISIVLTIFYIGGGNSWFLNDFVGDHSDLFSTLNSKIRELEPLKEDDSIAEETNEDEISALANVDDSMRLHTSELLSSLLSPGMQFPAPNFLSYLKQQKKPWYRGENVCMKQTEKNETDSTSSSSNINPFLLLGNAAFSTCRQTINKYICTTSIHSKGMVKTTITTYKCCEGSRRNLEDDTCEKVEVKSAMDVAKTFGSNAFADTVVKVVKKSVLDRENMTIFSPSDTALTTFAQSRQAQQLGDSVPVIHENKNTSSTIDDNSLENEIPNDKQRKTALAQNDGNLLNDETVVLGHFVEGIHDVHDLQTEQVLETIDGLPIRINVYHNQRTPLVTANCAIIKSANHPTSNGGMLHVTDAVIPPAKKTIKEMLLSTPEFSEFASLVQKADMMDVLSDVNATYTLFVPDNKAMSKLQQDVKSKLQTGESCLKTVVKAHLIPRTLCSGAVGELKVMTRNMAGNWLMLDRKSENVIRVAKDSNTTMTDFVTTNGVVHVVNNIIMPDSAKPVSKLLSEKNHTTWLNLIEKAGLKDELDTLENRTMFVPSEEALSKLNVEEMDEKALKDMIHFHTSTQSVCSCQLEDNLMLPTSMDDKQLRVNRYDGGSVFIGLEPTYTVQCGQLITTDEKACEFMVHEVDRVLKPATKTILETINTDESYSKLKTLMEGTALEAELKNGSLDAFTLLAPTDESFANLTSEENERLKDKNVADQLLRRHVITDVVCCNGIGVTSWPFSDEVFTASGAALNVRRRTDDQISFGGATTTECDYMATDGIIHRVNKLMIPRPVSLKGSSVKYTDSNGSKVLLFGI